MNPTAFIKSLQQRRRRWTDQNPEDLAASIQLIHLFSLPPSPYRAECKILFARWLAYVVHTNAITTASRRADGTDFEANVNGNVINFFVSSCTTWPDGFDFALAEMFFHVYKV